MLHFAGIAAVPVLIGGYLVAIRWATRTDPRHRER
jgi:hypothetical protein